MRVGEGIGLFIAGGFSRKPAGTKNYYLYYNLPQCNENIRAYAKVLQINPNNKPNYQQYKQGEKPSEKTDKYMEEIGPEPANKKMSPKNTIVLIITIVVLAICVFVAVLFNKPKPKEVAQTATPVVDIATLEKIVAADPSTANILSLAATYIKSDVPSRAFPYLKVLIKREPGNASAYCDLGVANIMLKNYKQGIEACTKAVHLDSTFQLAKNNLKWGLDERAKVLAAIDALNTRPEDKKDDAYYTLLGIYNFQVGDYEKSIAAWQTGVRQFPANSAVYYNNIGSAQVIEKQYAAATASFNKVLNIDPNNQLAKNNIVWANSDAAENKK
jgi:tetratricopeptide (TPR) repeat protein